jgi:hypothetical protein
LIYRSGKFSTKDTNIIVGVASHDKNIHDSKTLAVAISHANRVFEQAHADKTRSAFDKSQTTDIVAVCVAVL